MADVANGGGNPDEMDTGPDNSMGGVTYLCGGKWNDTLIQHLISDPWRLPLS